VYGKAESAFSKVRPHAIESSIVDVNWAVEILRLVAISQESPILWIFAIVLSRKLA
jgi:hypothetical protein